MKNMKSIFVIVAFFIMNILSAQPQGGGQQKSQHMPPPVPNEQQIKEMVSNLTKELSFSEEQEKKVLSLYVEHFKVVRAKREEMDTLKSDFENSVNALLSADQRKKYTVFLEKNQQRPPSQ